MFRKEPCRTRRDAGRTGWEVRKSVAGAAAEVGGFVCNKNSSFRRACACLDQEFAGRR